MSRLEQDGQDKWEPADRERVLRETARYLGIGRKEPDLKTAELIQWAVREIQSAAVPVFTVCEMPLRLEKDGQIQIGPEWLKSHDLARNLKDCGRVMLFAATLGAPADRLIQKYGRLDMAKAVALQAAAAAVLEDYCDSRNRYLKEQAAASGWYLRPRFSPGYGDFPITFQKPLSAMLTAEKRIGLTVTDAYMLAPVKSVTAVIGMGRTDTACTPEGCEACEKTDCVYRRN